MQPEGKRISQLTPDTSPTTDDFIVAVDGTTLQNKRVDLGSLPVSNPTVALFDTKVDKAPGKQLSDQNYTQDEKNKLAGIEAGAEVNEVTAAQLNGKTDFPTANLSVPVRGALGVQTSIPYSPTATGSSIVLRSGTGTISTGTPTADPHATTKLYVDNRTPIYGTGFPNGVVSATPGRIYIDENVTNGASSWIKKSGTGNTGWVVLEGETGWRNITSLVDPLSFSGGTVYIRRQNNTVEIEVVALVPASGNSLLIQGFGVTLPGFSPRGVYSQELTGYGSPAALGWLIVGRGAAEGLKIAAGTGTRWGLIQYPYSPDAQLWPTNLPGVSA